MGWSEAKPMSKEEASDLRSLIDRVVQCSLQVVEAQRNLKEAEQKLNAFLHRQEFPEQYAKQEATQ